LGFGSRLVPPRRARNALHAGDDPGIQMKANLGQLMRQAQQLQASMQKAQE
jgi:hypothetical protein